MKQKLIAVVLGIATGAVPAFAASGAHSADASAASTPAATSPASLSSALPIGAIAVVNGVQVKQAELDAAVAASKQPDTPALRTNLKNQLIARALFAQAAQAAHYDNHADVQAEVEQAKQLAMMQAYLRDNIKPAPVSEADVKAQFDKIVATLGENEYKPSVIVTNDADTAQKVIDLLKKNGDFAQLAKQYSVAPDAAQGGALNWVSFKTPLEEGKTQNWPLPVADALLKLPAGSISSTPIAAAGKFYILKVDQKRPTQVPDYATIKPALEHQMQQAAIQKATAELVIGLVKTAKIQQ
jgi:parvulin-like peptidyl-prolyl isomerase